MKEDNKIRLYVRYGFVIMIVINIIGFGVKDDIIASVIYSVIYLTSIIFCFVNSIRHLRKYKDKTFAIVALCVSSFLLAISIIAFFVGLIIGIISSI